MRDLKSGALLAIAMLVSTTSAFAGAGSITTVVTPLTTQVTYSADATTAPVRPALVTTVGYTVRISNSGGNTINSVRFTGATSVTDTAERATFGSVDGITTCQTTPTSVDCAIGQLNAGESAPTFAVFFNAPVKDAVTPIPDGVITNCRATDCVAFSGITYYAEGKHGPKSEPQNSTESWTAGLVTLGTFNPMGVKSAVPKAGGTYFTGDGGVSTGTDVFTSSVTIPTAVTYTTAEIVESLLTLLINPNCSNFYSCYRSDVTIPGAFSPYLKIVLRADASNIKPGTHINSVLIRYSDVTGMYIVLDCASPTTPRIDGLPCIAKRVFYRDSSVPGWTLELDGDFEWTLLNTKNGGYTID